MKEWWRVHWLWRLVCYVCMQLNMCLLICIHLNMHMHPSFRICIIFIFYTLLQRLIAMSPACLRDTCLGQQKSACQGSTYRLFSMPWVILKWMVNTFLGSWVGQVWKGRYAIKTVWLIVEGRELVICRFWWNVHYTILHINIIWRFDVPTTFQE